MRYALRSKANFQLTVAVPQRVEAVVAAVPSTAGDRLCPTMSLISSVLTGFGVSMTTLLKA